MLELILMAGCVSFFYKMGDMERSSGLLWGGVSVLLWVGSACFLGWGVLGRALTQVGLFAGITAWNCLSDRRRRKWA